MWPHDRRHDWEVEEDLLRREYMLGVLRDE